MSDKKYSYPDCPYCFGWHKKHFKLQKEDLIFGGVEHVCPNCEASFDDDHMKLLQYDWESFLIADLT